MSDDRHRVYMPGPHTAPEVSIVEHPDGCDLGACPVAAALADWLANPPVGWEPSEPWPYIAVEGDYFTIDGRTFERCAWQPGRPA